MKRPVPEMGVDGDWAFLRSRRRPRSARGSTVRIVDLFSGAGGMTLGALEASRSLGFSAEVVLAMELSDEVRAVYDANFTTTVAACRRDVRDRFDRDLGAALSGLEKATAREVGPIDLLLGGPPCQGHSSLNNHTRRRDPKNALYLRMLRAVEVLEPAIVVIENVPEVRLDSGAVVGRSIDRLERLGYAVTERVVAAFALGVPQLRLRHLLTAMRTRVPLSQEALGEFECAEHRDLRWAIGDIAHEAGGGLFTTPSRMSVQNLERARYLLRRDEYDLPNALRPPCHREKPTHKYKSMYGRLRWGEPAQTITTGFGSPGQGRYLHPESPRTLTPHEAARLQFFPDWFDFSRARSRTVLSQCIGNAVPSKVAFCLARAAIAASRSIPTPSRMAG